MSKTEKATREYLESLSKDRVIELCLQFMFDAEISEQQLDQANERLGNLEDMLEKYGVESVEELDKKLAYYIDKIDLEAENEYLKKAIEKQNRVSKSISKDRDTWQKACELACEREDDCYVYDNIHRAYEFYQQAKKLKGEL